MRRALLAAAALAAAAGTALAFDDTEVFGKVAAVAFEKDTQRFDLDRGKDGTLQVFLGRRTAIYEYRSTTLDKVEKGTMLHVLGRHWEEEEDRETGKMLPKRVTDLVAIVAGQDYEPPRIPEHIDEKRWAWASEKLERGPKGEYLLGEAKLPAGLGRRIVAVEKAAQAAIAKDRLAFVAGSRRAAGPGAAPARADASRVVLLAPEIKEADARVILGLEKKP